MLKPPAEREKFIKTLRIVCAVQDKTQLLKNFTELRLSGGSSEILKTHEQTGRELYEFWVDTSYSKHVLLERLRADIANERLFDVTNPSRMRR